MDVPEEYLGTVTSQISVRRGRMESMTNHGTGWVRIEFVVPARGLIGFRTQFLTETRGTGIMHHVFEGYEPWAGSMRGRATGSLVADRSGSAAAYAMFNLQERGSLFVTPGTEVYEGMIVGENSRLDDMDVNITRERKVTNVRQSTGEELERLVPPRLLSLEQALEFCADDECVEVTVPAVRLRKTVLDARDRFRERARASRAKPPGLRSSRNRPCAPRPRRAGRRRRYLSRSWRSRSRTWSGCVGGDPDHGPHRVGQRDPRHAEFDRGRVGPAGQLPVELGAEVQGDPDRLGPDRGPAGGPRVGLGPPRRRGRHLRLAQLTVLRAGHVRTPQSGAQRSMRSRATWRHTSQPACLIGTPKLCA